MLVALLHRLARVFVILLLICFPLSGCKRQAPLSLAGLLPQNLPDGREVCEKVGLCDAPLLAAELFAVLCDPTEGAPCTRERLSNTFDAVLAYAAERPGTHVQFWTLGATVASTVMLAEQMSPAKSPRGERAQKKQRATWAAQAREYLLLAAAPVLSAPRPRRSPLAEAITRLAIATQEVKLSRHFILITDALEVSAFGNFECRPTPSVAAWRRLLTRGAVLAPGSMSGVRVSFTYVETGGAGRCGGSIGRDLQVRRLWEGALTGAGATVSFTSGLIQFPDGAVVASTRSK